MWSSLCTFLPHHFRLNGAVTPAQPTLQSMHLFPYTFTFPLFAPGLAYGAALARAVRSLFSPILRVCPDPALNGSDVATLDVF